MQAPMGMQRAVIPSRIELFLVDSDVEAWVCQSVQYLASFCSCGVQERFRKRSLQGQCHAELGIPRWVTEHWHVPASLRGLAFAIIMDKLPLSTNTHGCAKYTRL